VWIYTGNKSAKFQENVLSLSENIAKSFRGATFFDSHCTPRRGKYSLQGRLKMQDRKMQDWKMRDHLHLR